MFQFPYYLWGKKLYLTRKYAIFYDKILLKYDNKKFLYRENYETIGDWFNKY